MPSRLKPLLFISLLPLASHAQVAFLFHTGTGGNITAAGLAFDNAAGSATYATGGITLTAEAFLAGVSTGTEMNGAGDGFGVNANGTGDNTTRFDNILGIESIVFRFDKAGTFDLIDLRYVTSEHEAVLSFEDGPTFPLNGSNALSASADTYSIGATFAAGQAITLSVSAMATEGETFSLESFTITPIPEPSAFAALAGLMALGASTCRRRRASI